MARIGGGTLKQRIARIVEGVASTRLSTGRKLLLATLALVTVGLPFAAGLVNTRTVRAQSAQPAPSFEVASIRPDPNARGWSMGADGSIWYDRGSPIANVLMGAFNVRHFQILNAPSWVDAETYDIQAKIPADIMQISEQERWKQFAPMMQTLLTERFHLRYHWVEQPHPVYSLVIDKGGLKLPRTKSGEEGGFQIGPGYFTGKGISMETLADNLAGNLDYIVQNRTGLKGLYDLSLHYGRPDPNSGSPMEDELSNGDAQARLFSALQDQAGLKLIAEKRPVKMLVVDSIDHPTPN